MPFKSQAQRAWMYMHHPRMAKRWSAHTPKGERLPRHVRDDRLPGGRADDRDPSDFDPRELAAGIRHEMEHTDDPDIAREIAMDHLAEDPSYYSDLRAAHIESLALAASQGPVQLALAEARENSTAMVVVAGDPPGRNVCAFVRGFTQDRTRVIVVAKSGKLAPGNFERMLRASMPDCEKKLRVMDNAGPSLVDALNSAQRNHHYSPSQALEVYCDQQTARGFQQEISDGSLKFDPTVIHIVPANVPQDDAGDIVRAVRGGDESAMHRVLDPHIFSSQEGIADYRQALLHESVARMIDDVLREFLTDIADDEEQGAALLDRIVRQNRALLKGRGVDTSRMQYLGTGANGSAWKLPDQRVLKVTTDDAEARVATVLKGKRLKHIFQVYDVWAFPGQYNGHHVYGLLTERDLEKPDESDQDEFDFMIEVLEDAYDGADEDLARGDLRKVLEGLMARQIYGEHDRAYKARALGLVKHFDLPGIMADLKRLGIMGDLHSGNFMLRPDGTYVLIDIGTAGGEEDQRPPFLDVESFFDIEVPSLDNGRLNEFGSGAPASGANGPPQMRGWNSSSWASGQLALKDPRNHVPEDENADEADSALDWGPGRVSGASA